MDISSIGNAIYNAIKDDASAAAKIRAERKTLAMQIATDPSSAAVITSSTVNNQSFTATPVMSNAQRLQLLSWICHCLDNRGPISKTQLPTF